MLFSAIDKEEQKILLGYFKGKNVKVRIVESKGEPESEAAADDSDEEEKEGASKSRGDRKKLQKPD